MATAVALARGAMNDAAAGAPAMPVFRVALGGQRAVVRPGIGPGTGAEVGEASFDRPEIVNNHSASNSAIGW